MSKTNAVVVKVLTFNANLNMNNPFALFDLAVDFNLDLNELNNRYLALQKSLHPDNFAADSAQQQRLAMQKSAEINDALQLLKDPISRADSIIALHTGEQVDLEQKSSRDLSFLMQQMEWRETLEQIEQQQNEAELEQFSRQIQQTERAILADLAQSLNSQDWAQAGQITDKLRFIKKLKVEIERVEDQLFAI